MVVGRLLGKRYQILEKIGCGGMAIVYRAKDIFLNRIVALKYCVNNLPVMRNLSSVFGMKPKLWPVFHMII